MLLSARSTLAPENASAGEPHWKFFPLPVLHFIDYLPTSTVAEGFVAACLLFGVGAMSIVGSLNSGLLGDHSMLFAKSLLDGVSSIVFSVSFGIGVPLSAIAVFAYEALVTLAAGLLSPLLSEVVIAEMTCVGSLMIIGLSLNMLALTKIKVMNFIPAVFLPILLCRFM